MSKLAKAVKDYYNDVPIPGIVESLLIEICAGSHEGKSVKEIADDLNARGYDVSKGDIKGVLKAQQKYGEWI